MKIWISGSVATDFIMDFPGRFADHFDPKKIHVLNLSFAVRNLKKNIGGTAANICYNLARLQKRPVILGAIGYDRPKLRSYLGKLGVNTAYLKNSKRRTAGAYIITDQDDNQITGFHIGAMAEKVRLPKVKSRDWAVIAAENPHNMEKLASHYQRNKVNYIFDPGQQITALSRKALRLGRTRSGRVDRERL